jgi:hypothetical protein
MPTQIEIQTLYSTIRKRQDGYIYLFNIGYRSASIRVYYREYSLMVKFFSVIEADAGSNPVVLVLVYCNDALVLYSLYIKCWN